MSRGEHGNKKPKPAKNKSLDSKLEEQFEDDLLGDLDKIPKAKGKKAGDPQRAGEDIQLPRQEKHPLAKIGRRMRTVEERLALGDSGKETQALQQEILAELAKMIDQTCKKCNGGGKAKPGNKSKPGQPKGGQGNGQVAAQGPQKSTQRLDKGKADGVKMDQIKKTIYRVWGHLPPQVQKSMKAAASERFLPEYQKLIEQYYSRLAEESSNAP